MCHRLECKQCGKYTWGGCGKHLTNLYASINEGKHCMCRSWPGVVLPLGMSTAQPAFQGAASTTNTTTGILLCNQ
ncbi:hypothetical protein NMG60_11026130 [Bertholletia excelsa]